MKRIAIIAAAVVLAVAHVRPAVAQQDAGVMPAALAAPAPSPFTADAPVSLAEGRGAAQAATAFDGRAAFVSHAGRNGAITGGVLGLAGGAFVGWVVSVACEYECDSLTHNIGGGALLGAGAGALVGWGLGEAWHAITR